jgi:hypothetical protein
MEAGCRPDPIPQDQARLLHHTTQVDAWGQKPGDILESFCYLRRLIRQQLTLMGSIRPRSTTNIEEDLCLNATRAETSMTSRSR